jgi:hypothetical protein
VGTAARRGEGAREAWTMYALGTARLSMVVCRWVAAGKEGARAGASSHALHQHVPVRRIVYRLPQCPGATPRARQPRVETAAATQPRTARSLCSLAACAPAPGPRLPICPARAAHRCIQHVEKAPPRRKQSLRTARSRHAPASLSIRRIWQLWPLTCMMRPTNGSPRQPMAAQREAIGTRIDDEPR